MGLGEKETSIDVNKYDMKKMTIMSIPIFIELFLQMLVGNIDQIMISRYSQNAVAAIGNSNQIMNILIIFLNVMGSGTTIVLARYLGAGNKKKVAETCTVSLFMLGILGVLASFILVVFHTPIFKAMNVPKEVLTDASEYMSIIGICVVVQALYMAFGAILRAYSMNGVITVISFIMNIMNVIGNAILIYGLFGMPKLGIAGVAISTNISKCTGLVIMILFFVYKLGIKISIKYLRPLPADTIKKIMQVAIPSGAEGISYNISQMVVLSVINTFGTYVINTKVYASMIANISYIYTVAIAQALQVVIGYLVGAGKKELITKKVWTVQTVATVVSVGLSIIVYFNSDILFRLFTSDEKVLALAHQVMLVEIFLEIGRSVNIVMVKALIAVGDVKYPVVCGIFFQWVAAALFSYILGSVCGLGLVGVWIAMAMDECFRGILFVIRFKSEKWKQMKVT